MLKCSLKKALHLFLKSRSITNHEMKFSKIFENYLSAKCIEVKNEKI